MQNMLVSKIQCNFLFDEEFYLNMCVYFNWNYVGTPQPWSGMKMATSFSSVCPQNLPSLNNSQQHFTSGRLNHMKRLMQFLQNESEDCLFLNLYVPEWCKYACDFQHKITQ